MEVVRTQRHAFGEVAFEKDNRAFIPVAGIPSRKTYILARLPRLKCQDVGRKTNDFVFAIFGTDLGQRQGQRLRKGIAEHNLQISGRTLCHL